MNTTFVAAIDLIKEMGAEVVIASLSSRKVQRIYDKILYNARNLVERFFCKLKWSRRVATRYDKLSVSYSGFVYLTATLIWLK